MSFGNFKCLEKNCNTWQICIGRNFNQMVFFLSLQKILLYRFFSFQITFVMTIASQFKLPETGIIQLNKISPFNYLHKQTSLNCFKPVLSGLVKSVIFGSLYCSVKTAIQYWQIWIRRGVSCTLSAVSARQTDYTEIAQQVNRQTGYTTVELHNKLTYLDDLFWVPHRGTECWLVIWATFVTRLPIQLEQDSS